MSACSRKTIVEPGETVSGAADRLHCTGYNFGAALRHTRKKRLAKEARGTAPSGFLGMIRFTVFLQEQFASDVVFVRHHRQVMGGNQLMPEFQVAPRYRRR